MKKVICVVIFWGAMWGIAEATLGYGIHKLTPGMGWIIWFPMAFYFMNKVYKKTGVMSSVLGISIIASCIKLVNLLMPIRIDRVLNPSISILLEGLVVFLAFFLTRKAYEKYRYKFIWVASISISWRLLYVPYIMLMPLWMREISPIGGLEPFIKFMLIESLINTLVIFGFICGAKVVKNGFTVKAFDRASQYPVVSVLFLIIAFIIQFVL